MPSRSPSRRSSPLSPRSRASSNRSPSYGIHSGSRRGRSPPTDGRRRRLLVRGSGARSGDGSSRGRGGEVRHPPRNMPPGSYPQSQFAGMQHSGSSQHSPRRLTPAGVKRHSYSPPLPVIASTSGLKRKFMPRPHSSSSSSSSPPRPQHRHVPLIKKKKIAVERMASSREPPIPLPVRKQSRSKSPVRDKVHVPRSSSHYSVREEDGNFDSGPVSKGSTYPSGGRSSGQTAAGGRTYTSSPRRHDNPPKRFMNEPVVRYSGGEGGSGDGRPIYRGPDKTESASYSDRELKQIKIGIRQQLPVDEPHINRRIVNPEDIVVVRRPGDSRLESISPQPFPSMERQDQRGESRPYYSRSPSPPPRIASGFVGRSRNYEQPGTSRASVSTQSCHKEGRRGEDLRYELEYRRRDDGSYERGTREVRTDSDGASSDLRLRINEKRTSDHRSLNRYHSGEGTSVIHSKVVGERVYALDHRRGDGQPEQRQRGPERSGGHHAVAASPHEIMESEDFPSRSSFHNKSSSSSIPSWDGNPEYVPKGRAYYEHDNRDEEWVRMGGRGGPRGGRGGRYPNSMGVRGRMFRGGYNPRGRGRGRGGGRGFFPGGGGMNRGYMRGGGIRRAAGRVAVGMGGSNSYSRGKATSPSLWKHDMFENLSSDENRPTSTSEMKP